VLPLEVDPTLNRLTFYLVVATLVLAVGTILLAFFQGLTVLLTSRQVKITREQVRAHLEITDPHWPNPGESPTANVEYVSGIEAAADACTWFYSYDGRRFAKAPNTPSPSRRSHSVTMEDLPSGLEPTWDRYFRNEESEIRGRDGNWWAAVTWLAADERRHGWMYIQRTHNTEIKQLVWKRDPARQKVKSS
jgi:hypothetical protein